MQTTPSILPIAFLGGTGMLLVAIGFLVYAWRQRLSWAYLALGALFWVITVAVKFAWAIPMNAPIYRAITTALAGLPGVLLASLYIGSLTGFTEVLITWLVLRFTRLGQVPWRKALGFGVGFGVVEALLLGLSNIANLIAVSAAPGAMPPAALDALTRMNDPLWGLAPVVERFFMIWVHIGACVLLFLAAVRKQAAYMWLAFAYNTLIDSVAAYGQLVGVNSLQFVWVLEAVVAVFGVAGWLITRWVHSWYVDPAPAVSPAAEPLPVTTAG